MSKNKFQIRMFLVLTLAFFNPALGLADSADDALIEKLDSVYQNLAPSNTTRVKVAQRLADLYSERARKKYQNESADNGIRDRQRALSLYTSIVDKVELDQKGKIQIQMGHLNELMGRSQQAEEIYSRITSSENSSEITAQAAMSKAELLYKQRKFVSAIQDYRKVLTYEESKSKGLANQRLAWCLFQIGKPEKAKPILLKILKEPKLLQRSATDGAVVIDTEFQQEVAHDLATFMAKTGASEREAKQLYKYSPEGKKNENVAYLASELERLGKDDDSIAIYSYISTNQANPVDRIESYAVLSELLFKKRRLDQSLGYLTDALDGWSAVSGKCENERCEEIKRRFKNLLVSWNQVEETAPSKQLIQAYQKYLQAFPDEEDSLMWYSLALKNQKSYVEASEIQARLINLYLKKKPVPAKQLEASLLLQIELAELSNDKGLLEKNLKYYSEKSKLKEKKVKVKYQLAKLKYDNKNYQQAAESLRAIVMDQDIKDLKIKTQAANLAMDSLVLLKDDEKLESWAKEFAKILPQHNSEYSKIAFKSVLNQTKEKSLKNGNLQVAWSTLNRADIMQASESDKITYYKNKLSLAEALRKFVQARVSADKLLSFKSLNQKDRIEIMKKKAWFAELNLNFKQAYETLAQIDQKDDSGPGKKKDHQLQLAILSDLAGTNSSQHYKNYLKMTDADDAIIVINKLLRSSRYKRKDIGTYKRWLVENPERLSYWQLIAYSEKPDFKYAQKCVNASKVKNSPGILFLKRELFLNEIRKLHKKIADHQIHYNNENQLARDIEARSHLIAAAEKLSQQAIHTGDWISQLAAFAFWKQSNQGFSEILLKVPVPDDLNADQKQAYSDALAEQVSTYRSKNLEIEIKINEYLQNQNTMQKVLQQASKQPRVVQDLLVNQLKTLASLDLGFGLAADLKAYLITHDESQRLQQTTSDLIELKQEVKSRPLAIQPLNKLIQWEENKDPNSDMVDYLIARREKISSLGGQNE